MSDFDRYIRQGEPAQAEKARIWQTAIGLQDVDGLKPSQYLRETAQRHFSSQSINFESPKSQFDTLKCSFEELAILKAVADNPKITQDELKEVIGKSLATVKRLTVSLQEKGILVRKNGKRNGYWETT